MRCIHPLVRRWPPSAPIRFPPSGSCRAWLLPGACRKCRRPPSVPRLPRAAESVLSPADARPGRTRPPRCLPDGSEWSTRRCGRGTCRRETGRRAIESRTPRSYAPPCQRPRYSAVTDPLGPPSDRTPRRTARSARHRPGRRHKVRQTCCGESGATPEPVALQSFGAPQSSRSPLHSDPRRRSHWNPPALDARCRERLLSQLAYTPPLDFGKKLQLHLRYHAQAQVLAVAHPFECDSSRDTPIGAVWEPARSRQRLEGTGSRGRQCFALPLRRPLRSRRRRLGAVSHPSVYPIGTIRPGAIVSRALRIASKGGGGSSSCLVGERIEMIESFRPGSFCW